MKQIICVLTIALLWSGVIKASAETEIILTAEVLHLFDGTSIGVNANVIELIGLVRREINNMLIGEKDADNNRHGRYELDGRMLTVEQLVLLEKDLRYAHHAGLAACLRKVKDDLKKTVTPFMDSARASKRQMLVLVEEDCDKRNNKDCLLLRWAEAPEGDEISMFDDQISSFAILARFCNDLLNFLGDLVRSCPKGREQFVQRVEKCKKVNQLLPEALTAIKVSNRQEFQRQFMHNFKTNHADKMTLTDITQKKVETLAKEYLKNQTNHGNS
jgi:hypothetical protein